ncbi:MAG: hypothetical protein V3T17_01035 [Pseudomonadales bacterium]
MAINTGHLTEADCDALVDVVNGGELMVQKRQSVFFLKLLEEEPQSNFRHGHSKTIKDIIRWAYQSGYRMIEFDCGAKVLPQFPVFG